MSERGGRVTTFKVQLYKGYSFSFSILAFLAIAVLIHTNRRGGREGTRDMMRMELREKWEVITFKLSLSLSFDSAKVLVFVLSHSSSMCVCVCLQDEGNESI